jgi:hypothetical protein
MKDIFKTRQDHELPLCMEDWGWKYHHTGIPTDKVIPNERYLPHLKFYVSGFNTSPFGIEWMRFDKDSPMSDIIKGTSKNSEFKACEELKAEFTCRK